MVHDICQTHSIASAFLTELRDARHPGGREQFRKNLERLGALFAFEISKTFNYRTISVETELGVSESQEIEDQVVLAAILRAGLPVYQGVLAFIPHAESCFVTTYRRHHRDGSFEVQLEYLSGASLDDKILILSDAVLASGSSIEAALNALQDLGTPKAIHVVAPIAATPGLNHLKRLYPEVQIWIAAEDQELTAKSYIVPGLGDAGDLAYGSKLSGKQNDDD